MRLNIYVACHKPGKVFKNKIFIPIQVGKDLSKIDLGFTGDNTGENISIKNKNFCELTALYWMWKNELESDYIGLVHYRRYFTDSKLYIKLFLNKISYLAKCIFKRRTIVKYNPNYIIKDYDLLEKNLNKFTENINKELKKYDVILPRKIKCNFSIETQYFYSHVKEDFILLEDAIKLLFPNIFPYFEKYKNGNRTHCYNMFIMKKQYFDEYMNFIFTTLFYLEDKIKISEYEYQARVFGFLSERLMTPFIMYAKDKYSIKLCEKHTIFFDE